MGGCWFSLVSALGTPVIGGLCFEHTNEGATALLDTKNTDLACRRNVTLFLHELVWGRGT